MSAAIAAEDLERAAQLLEAAKTQDQLDQARKEFEDVQEALVGTPGSRLVTLHFTTKDQEGVESISRRVYFEIEPGKYLDYIGLSSQ